MLRSTTIKEIPRAVPQIEKIAIPLRLKAFDTENFNSERFNMPYLLMIIIGPYCTLLTLT
jgi:hypothetical protein